MTEILAGAAAWLLADNEWRTTRLVAVGAGALLSWRALWLYVQSPPAAPTPGVVETAHAPAPRRWWKSRHERLLDAIALVRAENELRLGQVDGLKADAALAKAHAELRQLIASLAPTEPARVPAPTALTLREIESCVALVDLDPAQRATLQSLLIAALEENTHA